MKRITFMIVFPLLILVLMASPAQAQDGVNSTDGIDRSEAEAIARSLYPEATVVRAEQEFEDGVQTWDIKLNNGMAVYVNANTGDVVELERWQARSNGRVPAAAATNTGGVDFQAAQSIALSYYPNATVIDLDRDVERGITVWDVTLNNGVNMTIDAATGAVIELETESSNRSDERWQAEDRENRAPWAGFPGGRRAWEATQNRTPSNSPVQTANVTFEQAQQIAYAQYPGTTLVEGELTRRGPRNTGALAWDLELSNGLAVYVDATTGAILEVERWR